MSTNVHTDDSIRSLPSSLVITFDAFDCGDEEREVCRADRDACPNALFGVCTAAQRVRLSCARIDDSKVIVTRRLSAAGK